MSKELEKKIERFINKQEKLVGVEELNRMLANSLKRQTPTITESVLKNLIAESFIVSEAVLAYGELIKHDYKYLIMLINMMKNEQKTIAIVNGKKQQVTLKKDDKLINALENSVANKDDESIKNIFYSLKANNVIPIKESDLKLKITDMDKSPFSKPKASLDASEQPTAAEEGRQYNTSSEDFKEGMVCFFYSLLSKNSSAFNKVKQKILSRSSEKIDLSNYISLISDQLYGQKAANEVRNAVSVLQNGSITDTDEGKRFLNTISCAIAISQKIGNGFTIDRGDLYEQIKNAGAEKIGDHPDKWTPADVFLYPSGINKAAQLFEQLKKFDTVEVILDKDGKIEKDGLNRLFTEKYVIGVSLKDESSMHGKATGFVNVIHALPKDIIKELLPQNDPLVEEVLKKNKKIDTEKSIDKIYQMNVSEYSTLNKLIKNIGYQVTNSESGKKVKTKDELLFNYAAKNSCYKFVNYYLENYEYGQENVNEIMKSYSDPLMSLTAYGIGLTGFNPPFHKISGSSDGNVGGYQFYEERGTIKIGTKKVELLNPENKQGFLIRYIVTVGQKPYETTLDFRIKGGGERYVIIQVRDMVEA